MGRGLARPAAATPAASCGCLAEFEARADPEPVSHEVDFDGFNLLVKIFVQDELKAVHVEHIVGLFWLIQSHRQGRPASPTLVQENSNGRSLLVLEIFGNLIMRGWGDLNHVMPP
jgi:hypothetical protein